MGVVELLNGRVMHVSDNPATLRFYGRRPDGVRTKWPLSADELGMPRDVELLWVENYQKARDTARPVTFRYPHASGGEKIWLEATVNHISTSPEGIPTFSYLAHDITREVLENEENIRLRLLMEATTDLVVCFSKDEKILYANRAASHFFGFDPSNLSAHKATELHSPEEMARVRKEVIPAAMTGGNWFGEVNYLGKDGRQIPCSTAASIHRKPSGEPDFISIILRDLSQKKAYEREIGEQRRLLLTVMENLPVGLFVKDAKDSFRYLLYNKRLEQIFGLPRARVLGKTSSEIFPDRGQLLDQTDLDCIASKSMVEVPEHPMPGRNGTTVWARTLKVPVMDNDDKVQLLVGIVEDMTEHHRQREFARQQEAALVHASKMSSLGEMAGGLAHEINNPLAIIHGYSEKVLVDLKAGRVSPERIHSSVEKIMKTADRIAKIIKGLRSFARDGESDPYETASAAQLVQDTLEFCNARFASHGVKLEVAPLAEDFRIECKPVQLSQVLLNLLNNAYDAIEKTPDPWIRIEVAPPEAGRFRIRITDSGRGIPAEIAERIMQPFFTTKEVGKGTGLGLSISSGIIRDHKGTLTLDPSSPNTCFVIELPVSQEPRGSLAPDTGSQAA